MNIRFEYLYRDHGNLKNWGEIVFSNNDAYKRNIEEFIESLRLGFLFIRAS